MDENYNPFEHHPVNQRNNDPDYLDAELSANVEADRRRPPEEMMAIHDQAERDGYIRSTALPETTAISVEDESTRNELDRLRREADSKELARVTAQTTGGDPSKATDGTPKMETPEQAASRSAEGVDDHAGNPSAVEKAVKIDAGVEKPSGLESALSAIRLSPTRQNRVIISGNEEVKAIFYAEMAKDGKLFFQGGTQILSASNKEIAERLERAAAKVNGATAVHTLSMEMKRDSAGFYQGIKSAIANRLGREHKINAFAVGTPEEIQAKQKEVSDYVRTLNDNGKVKDGQETNGDSLIKTAGSPKPVTISGMSGILEALEMPIRKAALYNADQAAKAEARRAQNDNSSGKSGDAAAGDRTDKPVEPHKRTVELAAEFQSLFNAPAGLSNNNGRGQTNAEMLLNKARSISDPASPELSTLPDASRQKFVAQLAALAEKISDKEFDKGASGDLSKKLEENGKNGASPASRVNEFVNMEIARDDKFAEKVPALLKELVESKAITAEQAERIEQKISAMAVEAARGKAEGAPGQATTAASVAAQPAAADPATGATPAAENKDAQNSTATTQAGGPEAAADKAAVAPEATTSPSSQEQQPAQGKLEAQMAEIASLPPSSVSPDKAMAVLADLDAKQSMPLSKLDAGEGAASTTTVTRLEGFLQKAESGEFGSEAAAYASNLKGSMERWKENDQERSALTGQSHVDYDAQVAKTKEVESAWHDQPRVPSALSEAAAVEAKVVTAESPATASSGEPTAAPEKAPAPATESAPKPGPAVPTEQDLAKEAQRLEGVQKLATTEASAGKIMAVMNNPAGSLTNRDKTWNEQAVANATDRVLSLDADSMDKMSPSSRDSVIRGAVWLASKALDRELPGFDGPEGRAKAKAMGENAIALSTRYNVGTPTEAQSKLLEKADRMVGAMAAREKVASMETAVIREPSTTRTQDPVTGSETARATQSMAKDLVHAVYRGNSMSAPQIKHTLKNAARMTPQTLKGMDPQTKAQAAVALKQLVSDVRGGLLGDMSPGLKQLVAGAQQASNKLHSALGKTPGMPEELSKAANELTEKTSGASSKASDLSQAKGQAGSVEDVAAKSGREQALER